MPVGAHHLDLEVVVARAEGAELLQAALEGAIADVLGVCPRQAAAPFRALEVLGPPVPVPDTPAGALPHDVRNADAVRRTKPRAPTPLGTARKSASTSSVSRGRTSILGELRAKEPHPAVDVEADAARRDDARVGAKRGHPADREAVAPVAVGHAERGAHDPGQAGDVRHLLEHAGVHLPEQRLGGVDARGHEHARLLARRDLPDAVAGRVHLHGVRCRSRCAPASRARCARARTGGT